MLAAAIMLSMAIGDTFCYDSPVNQDCAVQTGEQPLPADPSIMEPVWTYGTVIWAGNPYCPKINSLPIAPNGIGACQMLVATTPPPPLVCTKGTETLTGCYYVTATNTLVLVRNDGTSLNFDWGQGSPDPSLPMDGFNVVWEGNFTIAAGTYIFTTTVDDGVRLFVDGVKIIDQWFDQSPTTYTAQQKLTAGVHDIRMEYYENGGGAMAKLSWALLPPLPANPSGLTLTIGVP